MSKWKNDSAYKSVQSAGCDPLGLGSSPSEKSTAAWLAWAQREGMLGMEVGGRIWDAGFNPTGMRCQPCHEGKSHIPVCTTGLCHKTWLHQPCRDITY